MRTRKRRPARILPFVAVVVTLGLMLLAAFEESGFLPWAELAVGGAAVSVLLAGRRALERARTDGSTGLANGARFRAASTRGLLRGARTGRLSAVLLLDLNLGQEAVTGFAQVLRSCVPAQGLACRLDGDRFAVVLAGLHFPEQAYEVAGALASALAPVVAGGRLVPLTAGIGVAVSAPGELGHDELVHRAELAMQRAKRVGPETRWAVWHEPAEREVTPPIAA
ncbi:GGDEF domain-containing protein [Actinoplanes sp. URMC 104]|uniref:GGDEF domain-containing protein n=1 Tax=Actinoplanes sp. URMC 104 TaxID=3423409 RepID=UPI003F1E0163